MMFTIRKQFEFSAAHQLNGLPENHQCSRLHGHNYIVEVELQSHRLDDRGFVVDYGELKALRHHLDANFEHRCLNDFFSQPTAETIAAQLFHWCKQRWPQTVAVSVSETPKTWARFEFTESGEQE